MANRAMRRKEKIKNERRIIPVSDDPGMPNLFKVLVVVVIVFVVFYILTIVFSNVSTKKSSYDNNESTANEKVQYDEILAGETFNMSDAEYYVMFYDSSAIYADTYKTLISNYKDKDSSIKIYNVDLNNGMNKSYIADNSNSSATTATELKINGPTLIKITNGSNSLYVEGLTNIKTTLGL